MRLQLVEKPPRVVTWPNGIRDREFNMASDRYPFKLVFEIAREIPEGYSEKFSK